MTSARCVSAAGPGGRPTPREPPARAPLAERAALGERGPSLQRHGSTGSLRTSEPPPPAARPVNPAPARTRRKGALPTTAARDTLVSARRRHFLGRDEHSREVTRRPGVPVEQAAETRVGLQSPDARRPPFPSTRSLARPAASSSDPRQCNAPRLSTHVARSAWHTAAFGPIGVPGVSSLYII